jgi:predicted metal-dependent peptidase
VRTLNGDAAATVGGAHLRASAGGLTAGDRQHLAAARLWAANRAPYFATALFALSPAAAGGLGTVGVDRTWHLYIDPAAVTRWTVEEFGGVLIHEVHHLLRAHADRAAAMGVGAAEARRWNIAADFEINDDLEELLPGHPMRPADHGFEPGLMAETYYLQLSQTLPSGDCGSGAHGLRLAHELDDPAGGVTEIEADLIRREAARNVISTAAIGGAVPSGLARWAQATLQPQIDWRRELAAQVRAGIDQIAGGVDYSYRRRSRRSGSPIGRAVVLPALVQPVPRVCVVVDTSGSMGEDRLRSALGEVNGILQARGTAGTHLAVLSCDSDVRNVQEVFVAAQIQLVGGGGTDMKVAIRAACDRRPRPDLVVIITDGFTPWPSAKPPCEVVVALLGDGPTPPRWAHSVRVPSAEEASSNR